MMITPDSELITQTKALSMVTYSMMLGLFLFMGVSYLVIDQVVVAIQDHNTATYVMGASVIVAVIVLKLAKVFLQTKQEGIKEIYNRNERVQSYRNSYFIFLALTEAVGIIGIICFLLTAKPLALAAPCMSIIQMFVHRPTEQKVMNLLG